METKESVTGGRCGFGEKNKKVLLIGGLISFAVAVVIIGIVGLNGRNRGNMMGFGGGRQGRGIAVNNITYAVPTTTTDDSNRFVVPQDASKSGELAITVGNIDMAKNSVSAIAAKNSGSVYASFIAYSSNNIKNGSIVVQVPAENFDNAFAELRGVGTQVVQESTRQIEQRVAYPVVEPVSVNDDGLAVPSVSQVKNDTTAKQPVAKKPVATAVTSTDAMAITPPIQLQSQDKGYIRIVFADYGAANNPATANASAGGSMMRYQGAGQLSSRNIIWIGFGIKVLLLLVLIYLLVHVFRKIFHNLKLSRNSSSKINTRLSEKKSVAHVIRQVPHSRIINIKKK